MKQSMKQSIGRALSEAQARRSPDQVLMRQIDESMGLGSVREADDGQVTQAMSAFNAFAPGVARSIEEFAQRVRTEKMTPDEKMEALGVIAGNLKITLEALVKKGVQPND
jgi:hypothetical protein